MTDSELVRACAEQVMGWMAVSFSAEDRKEEILPRLIENIERDWILCDTAGVWRKWDPLSSDADAFMLVESICSQHNKWFRLQSPWEPKRPDAVRWSAGFTECGCTGWNGRPDIERRDLDRRRAIVLTVLAVTEEAGKGE